MRSLVPLASSAAEATFSATPDRAIVKGAMARPLRTKYDTALIKLALDKTRDSYGPYTLELNNSGRKSKRIFNDLGRDKDKLDLNIYITATSKQRETQAHAIQIPVYMGLGNYRLIVTRPQHLAAITKVDSLEGLSAFQAGSVEHWSLTHILKFNGFSVSTGRTNDAIFKMLNKNRFQFLLRGINELYVEQNDAKKEFGDSEVVPKLMVYLPLPYFIFVAPAEKRLAQRIEAGLSQAIADGSFRSTFLLHFKEFIEKASLSQRKAIYLHNPLVEGKKVLLQSELWYLHDAQLAGQLKANYSAR